MFQTESSCIRLQKDEKKEYYGQVCGERPDGYIKCIPDYGAGDRWICKGTDEGVRCVNKFESSSVVEGTCIVANEKKSKMVSI